jgi:hypothetical protein
MVNEIAFSSCPLCRPSTLMPPRGAAWAVPPRSRPPLAVLLRCSTVLPRLNGRPLGAFLIGRTGGTFSLEGGEPGSSWGSATAKGSGTDRSVRMAGEPGSPCGWLPCRLGELQRGFWLSASPVCPEGGWGGEGMGNRGAVPVSGTSSSALQICQAMARLAREDRLECGKPPVAEGGDMLAQYTGLPIMSAALSRAFPLALRNLEGSSSGVMALHRGWPRSPGCAGGDADAGRTGGFPAPHPRGPAGRQTRKAAAGRARRCGDRRARRPADAGHGSVRRGPLRGAIVPPQGPGGAAGRETAAGSPAAVGTAGGRGGIMRNRRPGLFYVR